MKSSLTIKTTAQATIVLMGLLACSFGLAQVANTPNCTAQTCTLQDFEAVREATEVMYGDVLLVLSAHERPALRADQNEWRRSARAACNQSAPAGADLQLPAASAHHACMIAHDMERRQKIRHWLMNGYSVD